MFGLFYNISLTNNLGSKSDIVNGFDEVYKFAVDMDGAGFAFSGYNDTGIMHNSAVIHLQLAFILKENN